MGGSSSPKQTEQQKELEQISIEREKQLRVENAKQTTKTFSDNLAFRRKLRGMFSLLSGGFKGFEKGSTDTGSPSFSSGASGSGSSASGVGVGQAVAPPPRASNSGGGRQYRVGIAK